MSRWRSIPTPPGTTPLRFRRCRSRGRSRSDACPRRPRRCRPPNPRRCSTCAGSCTRCCSDRPRGRRTRSGRPRNRRSARCCSAFPAGSGWCRWSSRPRCSSGRCSWIRWRSGRRPADRTAPGHRWRCRWKGPAAMTVSRWKSLRQKGIGRDRRNGRAVGWPDRRCRRPSGRRRWDSPGRCRHWWAGRR